MMKKKFDHDEFEKESFKVFFSNIGVNPLIGEKIDNLLRAGLSQFDVTKFFNRMDEAIQKLEDRKELTIALKLQQQEKEIEKLKIEINDLQKQNKIISDILL